MPHPVKQFDKLPLVETVLVMHPVDKGFGRGEGGVVDIFGKKE
jgi:hypothetical protein